MNCILEIYLERFNLFLNELIEILLSPNGSTLSISDCLYNSNIYLCLPVFAGGAGPT